MDNPRDADAEASDAPPLYAAPVPSTEPPRNPKPGTSAAAVDAEAPTQDVVRLALIQHACPPGQTAEANTRTATDMIRDAASQGAQIVATQELFTGPYFPQTQDERNFQLAEPIPGPTSRHLCELAKELRICLTASLFERRTAGLYHNTSVMIDPAGTIIGKYRKMHIPDDPRFFEKYYFTPGDPPPKPRAEEQSDEAPDRPPNDRATPGWQVQQTPHAKTGMLVCWDQWFPEAARITTLRGAQILFFPTAIAWQPEDDAAEQHRQRDAWVTVQRSHAIANSVFVCAINRTGVENDLTFWGSSFIADPRGTVIAQAPADEDAVIVADCDLSLIETTRRGWPFLRDRRIDAYADLLQRFADDGEA